MSNAAEIWNLNALCRCCHTDGNYKNLAESFWHENGSEIYSIMLRDTLNIEISRPLLDASYTICDECIISLRDAARFKKQVIACEEKFQEYCKNELISLTNNEDVKIEVEIGTEPKHDIKIKEENPDYEDSEIVTDDFYSFDVKFEEDDGDHEIKKTDKKEIKKVNKKEVKIKPIAGDKKKSLRKKKSTTEKQSEFDYSQRVVVTTESGTTYSCKTCGGTYKDQNEIRRHITANHLLVEPYPCDKCPKTFKTKAGIKAHRVRHEKDLKCPYCSKCYHDTFALKEHVNGHTKSNIYTCDFCAKDFLYRGTLIKHLRKHYGTEKKCICDICGHRFCDNRNLEIHIRTVHEKQRNFICDICQKTYSSKKHLTVHILKHMGYRPFPCDNCQKSFYTGFDRKSHKCSAQGTHDKRYTCKLCFKIFNNRSSFCTHLKRSHSGDKPYQCSFCGKEFTCRYSKNRHELSHSDVEPFSCNHCDMKFKQKGILNRHIKRMHNPAKNAQIQCRQCKRVVVDLKQHNLNCHDNRIMCDICNRSYSNKNTLNRHKRIDHKGLKHKCDYCTKTFGEKHRLDKHLLKLHGVVLKVENNIQSNVESNVESNVTDNMFAISDMKSNNLV